MQFQKRKYAKLGKFQCGKKGYGLKLLEDVPKGNFLIEYVGEVTVYFYTWLFGINETNEILFYASWLWKNNLFTDTNYACFQHRQSFSFLEFSLSVEGLYWHGFYYLITYCIDFWRIGKKKRQNVIGFYILRIEAWSRAFFFVHLELMHAGYKYTTFLI